MQIEDEAAETDLFLVSAEEAGKRVDRLLVEHYANAQSRRYFQRLIQQKNVLVNREPVNKKDRLKEADEVSVTFSLAKELTLEAEDIPLAILFEDEHLAAIDKPAGMVVHPAPGNWSGTLVNALLYRYGSLEGPQLRPGIVHRLDKQTSGVLIVAKTLQAHARLVQLFSAREVEKLYLALTCGNPGEGVIDTPIARHPKLRKQMAVDSLQGRKACTHYRTLCHKDNIALVQLNLLTGRTHQARVHLRHIGFPILGDATYGSAAANRRLHILRQMLHAHKLRIVHPFSGKSVEFMAPIPEDMSKIIERYLPNTNPCK